MIIAHTDIHRYIQNTHIYIYNIEKKKCNKYKLFVFVEAIDLEKIEEEGATVGEITHHLYTFAANAYKEAFIRKKVCISYLSKS